MVTMLYQLICKTDMKSEPIIMVTDFFYDNTLMNVIFVIKCYQEECL